jgi:hypothetical protein
MCRKSEAFSNKRSFEGDDEAPEEEQLIKAEEEDCRKTQATSFLFLK